ncbi:MAG: YebC/PmpR family DNA-binding transcriptional regulator [Planctomycetes bacterium]|nr:YebC/PmpR family DNA-binding transcriptional regulator [Planctomycetota bacterium]MBI3844596.1 YebC/PmpR family DNA-binding transcriptional regulator [Planctomycetota bacterium]
MSGHSHWATIKHAKAASDAKKGKVFSKIAKMLTSASRHGGADPDMNLKLKYAMDKARAANMSKDSIERAIKKGTGDLEGETLTEVTYEGYGPGGVAILVDAVTDNRARTVSEIRNIFDRCGGKMAESGSVGWMFEKRAFFTVERSAMDEEALMSAALDAGADDVRTGDLVFEVLGSPSDFEKIKKALVDKKVVTKSAEITNVPKTVVPVSGPAVKKVFNLLEELDEHDDVSATYANFDVSEQEMKALAAEAAK